MPDRSHLIVAAAITAAAIGDVVTTIYGIESGAMVEGNPYVIAQLEAGGYPLWLFVKTVGVGLTHFLYGATRRIAADGYEWAGYTAPFVWTASHAAVTAHNGMLLLSA